VSQHGEAPKTIQTFPARSDPDAAVDLVAGIVGESVGAALAVLRGVTSRPALRSPAVWRPPFLPTRFQPASLVDEVVRRGARHRIRAVRQMGAVVDQWAPVLVEYIAARVDLTNLVLRHLDIDRVVGAADLDAAVSGVDIDAIAGRIDIDAILARVDLVAIVEDVMAEIDLPAIIRDSSGSMASETVRGARMTGITVDEAISRALDRRLFRGRRSSSVDADQ